jgi:ketosteroid isomerase-like protein
MDVIVDQDNGRQGDISEWVATFGDLWAGGRSNLDRLVGILSPDVRLSAPGLRSTQGRSACRESFRKTFDLLPDLRGYVLRWSASGDVVFIEMTFRAAIGGRPFEWHNVDRLLFREGLAVDRRAFYDTGRIRRAFLKRPSGWMHLLRRIASGL